MGGGIRFSILFSSNISGIMGVLRSERGCGVGTMIRIYYKEVSIFNFKTYKGKNCWDLGSSQKSNGCVGKIAPLMHESLFLDTWRYHQEASFHRNGDYYSKQQLDIT